MTEWWFELIKSNWGITFHFIFSLLLVQLGYIFLGKERQGYTIAGVFAFGGCYELYQSYCEAAVGKGTVEDLIANVLGITVGVIISLLLLRK